MNHILKINMKEYTQENNTQEEQPWRENGQINNYRVKEKLD